MKTFSSRGASVALAILVGWATMGVLQTAGMEMAMPTNTLLVAQLDAKQVVGGSASAATGTGAFLLDPAQRTLEYSLTYQGLEAGGASSIALYNFGKSNNGEAVKMLCGAGARPCPSESFATITGRFEREEGRPLDNHLIGEFDSERVYVEIVGGSGKPEIRGQLGPNGAMVQFVNYVAHLAPVEGSSSKGSGTAVYSETYLPGGKVSVFYAATVAGTSGAPVNAALSGDTAPKGHVFVRRMALPKLRLILSRDKKTGGSLSGLYQVDSAAPNALLATPLQSKANGAAGIVVTTTGFPAGELYGALVPMR
jgi:hypothetical protein